MNLKYSGLIFVLLVIADAINGLAPSGNSTTSSSNEPVKITSDKNETMNNSDLNLEKHKTTTTSTTTTTTTSTTTTTTSTTTTTTPAPPTTTPHPSPEPTPAPSPTPVPVPEKGTWVIRNETAKTTCVIAEMAMQLNVTYPAKGKNNSAILNIPKNATVNGSCSDPTQEMTLNWKPGHSLTIRFTANKTANNFYVSGLVLNVNATVFKDANDNGTWTFTNTSSEFKTPLKMSYKCDKEQDLNLESGNPDLKAVLSLKDTQIEAYMNKTKTEFGAAQNCDLFDTPDVVPIAVGCALAILVLVVLAAYLLGRRRSQNRGYLSM